MVLQRHSFGIGNPIFTYLRQKVNNEKYDEFFNRDIEEKWELLAKIINKLHEDCCEISSDIPHLHGSPNCKICKYVEEQFTKSNDQKWMDIDRDQLSDSKWIRKAINMYKDFYIYKDIQPQIKSESYSNTLANIVVTYIKYDLTKAGETCKEEDINLLYFILEAVDEFEKIQLFEQQEREKKHYVDEWESVENRIEKYQHNFCRCCILQRKCRQTVFCY